MRLTDSGMIDPTPKTTEELTEYIVRFTHMHLYEEYEEDLKLHNGWTLKLKRYYIINPGCTHKGINAEIEWITETHMLHYDWGLAWEPIIFDHSNDKLDILYVIAHCYLESTKTNVTKEITMSKTECYPIPK